MQIYFTKSNFMQIKTKPVDYSGKLGGMGMGCDYPHIKPIEIDVISGNKFRLSTNNQILGRHTCLCK